MILPGAFRNEAGGACFDAGEAGSSRALSVAISVLALVFAGEARADKRVALVIGNSAYQNVARLDNPRNDAKLMADTLRSSASR